METVLTKSNFIHKASPCLVEKWNQFITKWHEFDGKFDPCGNNHGRPRKPFKMKRCTVESFLTSRTTARLHDTNTETIPSSLSLLYFELDLSKRKFNLLRKVVTTMKIMKTVFSVCMY